MRRQEKSHAVLYKTKIYIAEIIDMKIKPVSLLRLSFIIGVIADAIVAINWFLISLGYSYANLISAFRGSGVDYEFAMFISSLFMFGWTAILFWGYLKPEERKGLLLITSSLLLVSIILESVGSLN
jgi:hypothetical protein